LRRNWCEVDEVDPTAGDARVGGAFDSARLVVEQIEEFLLASWK
jgi:hypothetical protein